MDADGGGGAFGAEDTDASDSFDGTSRRDSLPADAMGEGLEFGRIPVRWMETRETRGSDVAGFNRPYGLAIPVGSSPAPRGSLLTGQEGKW